MFSLSLCAPSLIYIGFSIILIIIDIYKGIFSKAFVKFIVMIIISTILNILCNLGYTIISWILVFIPIIMMTLISTLLLKIFGTNPNRDFLKSHIKNITKKKSSNQLINPVNQTRQRTTNLISSERHLPSNSNNSNNRIDRDNIESFDMAHKW